MKSFSEYIPIFQINMNDVISTIMNNDEVKQSIIDYNQEQLQSGIDSLGQRIQTIAASEQDTNQVYSLYTIQMRASKGLQTGNVDLKDTGEFYNSMNVKVNENNVEVLADFDKPDGNIMDNFDNKYDFLGLTKENLKGFGIWVVSDFLGLELKKRLKIS